MKLFIASFPVGVLPDSVETNTRMLPNFVPVYLTMPLIPIGGVVGVAVRGTGVGVDGTGVADGGGVGVAIGGAMGVSVGDDMGAAVGGSVGNTDGDGAV
jgi:hypothetical protein